ncbi:MAG: hypothetical protein R2867_24750 [Caldilineaceae bacterium]
MRDYLAAKHNFTVSGTMRRPRAKRSRVSHMGALQQQRIFDPLPLGIEEFLRGEKDIDVPLGASLVGLDMPGY